MIQYTDQARQRESPTFNAGPCWDQFGISSSQLTVSADLLVKAAQVSAQCLTVSPAHRAQSYNGYALYCPAHDPLTIGSRPGSLQLNLKL
eukprot:g68686.t1